MRRFIYLFALAVAAIGALFLVSGSSGGIAGFLARFAFPLPELLLRYVPPIVRLFLALAFVALIARRVFILFSTRNWEPPAVYTAWPHRLLFVAVVSFILAFLGLLLSFLFKVGSGVPAGMLAMPAALLLGPTLFFVEVRSLPWFGNGPPRSGAT